jgi:uncharacterized protein
MAKVYIRFYEELNDFLTDGKKRKTRFGHEVPGSPSVKDTIESLGVPHTEVDLIMVNDKSVDFSYNIKDGDDISIYPVFESFEISGIQHLRPHPLREPRFILDVHLGSLAKYMRLAGFDSLYRNDLTDEEIVSISLKEKRTILTKSRELLKRSGVTHGYWIRNTDVREQLKEVIQRFQLERFILPFTLCLECNSRLAETGKEEVEKELPPKVKLYHNEFKRCPGCGKIYWKGTHYEKMHRFIEKLKNSL